MDSLVDQFCAQPHSTGITAAAHDAASGATITADAWGTVAITPAGERWPRAIFDMDAGVEGAVALSAGGSLAAVGDSAGTVAVYRTWDSECVFEDLKEGPAGAARGFRALSFNPQGTILAALSIDGIIRIFDIQRWERLANFKGFGGTSLQFDAEGDRLLCIDNLGQPKLVDLLSNEIVDLEMVPGGVTRVCYTPDNRHVVALGPAGMSLLELPSGLIQASFSAKGSSGMLTAVISPEGDRCAAITGRSLHTFSLPDLQPIDSKRHGCDDPTDVAWWDGTSVVLARASGPTHRPGARLTLAPVVCCAGFGEHRVAVHGTEVAIWQSAHQKRPFQVSQPLIETRIDRDGRILLGLGDDGTGVHAYEARTGKHLFKAGPETANTARMEVGGHIVACMLDRGGIRWYDLKNNKVYELPWVQGFALSGSGTWLSVITPQGRVRVLDPATGKDAVPAPSPTSDRPIEQLSFVNRRPDMLCLDEHGVLVHYDLTEAVTESRAVSGTEIIDLNVAVDRLWGITGGRYAAVRFQEEDSATVIFVDLKSGDVISEVNGLLPYAWVDPETGHILQPVRGAAILELDMYGKEQAVLRALSEGQWVSFGPSGITAQSSGFQP